MNYKLLDASRNIYAIILDAGDEVMETLQTFANERSLTSARFTAIGAFKNAELGYFDYAIKDYQKIPVNEQVEVLSMMGDIALYGDKAKVHAHIVLGRSDGSTLGGHLIKGIAHPTLEIMLEQMPGYLQREIDQTTGLPLIKIT